MRIIGVELRLKYPHPHHGWQYQEIALIPCDVTIVVDDDRLPGGCSMNATIHTNTGDININDFPVPFPNDSSYGLKVK